MPDADAALTASVGSGIAALDAAGWDALHDSANPFVSHAFLALLEESGSVGPGTGWQAAPILIHDAAGALVGAAPAYLKGHSQGEYVFDHAWADAWHRAGGEYYPKLQIAVPFTPATGPRLLADDASVRAHLIAAMQALVEANDLSSAHATFLTDTDAADFAEAGWLAREDTQFHWTNAGFADFDSFLATLSSNKRKAIRRERRDAAAQVRAVRAVTGDAASAADWDAMWDFYQDTGARKWGRPYLTRAAFDLLAERMGAQVLLTLADDADGPVAGALHIIGRDTLFGRYWGCRRDIPMLHFELCYYQAIDFAIARGLARVEAGAQGGHKLARGYAPVATHSAHWIPHPGFRKAVAEYLNAEMHESAAEREWLLTHTPFRKI